MRKNLFAIFVAFFLLVSCKATQYENMTEEFFDYSRVYPYKNITKEFKNKLTNISEDGDSNECPLPCFMGIEAGITTVEEIESIIRDNSNVFSGCKVLESSTDISEGLDCDQAVISFENEKINDFTIYFDSSLQLDEVTLALEIQIGFGQQLLLPTVLNEATKSLCALIHIN